MLHLRFAILDLRLAATTAALLMSFWASAHDSPEHVVAQLTTQMASSGTNASLLWQRATEYRALGRLVSAARDLRQAIKLNPDLLPAQADLARVELALGKTSEALETIDRALTRTRGDHKRAPLYMTRAEIYQARSEFGRALDDCERAFRLAPVTEPEWYLTRSELQARLGRFEESAAGLESGFEHMGNPVLEAEWIDALLDVGHFRQALQRIEPRLAESRLQSSWLLRRARARLGLGQSTSARGDLHATISEINDRLNPMGAEPGLLAERGFAYALLGDLLSARNDLKAARKVGAESWMVRRLELAVGENHLVAAAKKPSR